MMIDDKDRGDRKRSKNLLLLVSEDLQRLKAHGTL